MRRLAALDGGAMLTRLLNSRLLNEIQAQKNPRQNGSGGDEKWLGNPGGLIRPREQRQAPDDRHSSRRKGRQRDQERAYRTRRNCSGSELSSGLRHDASFAWTWTFCAWDWPWYVTGLIGSSIDRARPKLRCLVRRAPPNRHLPGLQTCLLLDTHAARRCRLRSGGSLEGRAVCLP